jgi:hypothetical protein
LNKPTLFFRIKRSKKKEQEIIELSRTRHSVGKGLARRIQEEDEELMLNINRDKIQGHIIALHLINSNMPFHQIVVPFDKFLIPNT